MEHVTAGKLFKRMFEMNLNELKKRIKKHEVKALNIFHYYSIFIPVIEVDAELHLLYELRSEELKRQPGEISFPGGRIEKDEGVVEAAVRETCEELNINQDNLEVWGELDYMVTPYNMIVYSCAGLIKDLNISELKVNRNEVEEVFTVPVDYLLNYEPELYNMTCSINELNNFPYHLIQNGKEYQWREGSYPIYFYRYKERIIWGFTALMTKNFLDLIK
jgi:peroxisomal coenzyme A diphosphatase NUDT7